MAVYLASFNENAIGAVVQEAMATRLETQTSVRTVSASSMGARIYEGACAVCHQVGGPMLFGSRPSLALNSNLHSAVPDNLIQVILHGIDNPVSSDLGYMPAFKNSFNDEQVTELVSYLRRQFAPDKAPWTDVASAVRKIRRANPP
jgi:nicotinate dehydrogenase subunit B